MPDNVLDALEKVKYLKESNNQSKKFILEEILTKSSMADLLTIQYNILVVWILIDIGTSKFWVEVNV